MALSVDFASPLAIAPSMFAAAPSVLSAAAPSAAVLAPMAIARLPAAADGPAPADKPVSESDAANAGARFDGTAAAPSAAPSAVPAASAVPSAPLGSGLRMARAEHDTWLASVVGTLAGTRTGRRVLRDIDRLAASRGTSILLDVAPIGNNGEFRYDSDLLVMDSGHLRRDPAQSAPILAHELQHVLQRAMNLPTDALELEIESYTVENRVWGELGVKPDAGSFARQARDRITKDADRFVRWLGQQYKTNIPLHGSTLDAYVARLKKNLAAIERTEARTRRKRAAVVRVLESMRANGMSEAQIEAHRQEALEPLDRSLRDSTVNAAWAERDLRMLSEPEGRERFRAFSRGVIRRARALSRS